MENKQMIEEKIWELCIEVNKLKTENKMLRGFNDSLIQALHKPNVSGSLENHRKDFCIWYYAQTQPLDANKVFAWFYNDR